MVLSQRMFSPSFKRAANPTVNDDSSAGHEIGTIWINTATDDVFVAANVGIGVAVWQGPVGSGGAGHAAVTLGVGSDPALVLAGQELTLADLLSLTEHTAIGNSAPHHTSFLQADADLLYEALGDIATHAAVANSHHDAVTLAADADTILGLSGQQLTLDSQDVNLVFSGPAAGGATDPTFRALVIADIPLGIDHGGLDGRDDDDHALYVMLAGRAGGQIIYGGTGAGENSSWRSTSHATKGQLNIEDVISVTIDPSQNFTVNNAGGTTIFIGANKRIRFPQTGSATGVLFGESAQLYVAISDLLTLAAGDAFNLVGGVGDFGAPANGTLWYNTTTGKFRVYESGAWTDMVTEVGDIDHDALTNFVADEHFDKTSAFPTTWSDTDITGAELETLSDGSDADAKHSHSNHGVTHNAAHVHDADVVTYTPAVATDWDGDADPGDTDDALDQLAERIDDVEGVAGHAEIHGVAKHTGIIGEQQIEILIPLTKPLPAATNNATLDDDYLHKKPYNAERRINKWYIRFESNLAAEAIFQLKKNGAQITGAQITVSAAARDAAVDDFTEVTLATDDYLEVFQTGGNAEDIGGKAYVYGDEDVMAAIS